jgi:hypothetical protein
MEGADEGMCGCVTATEGVFSEGTNANSSTDSDTRGFTGDFGDFMEEIVELNPFF